MGMEVTHDVTDHARTLAVGAGGPHARVVHAEQHTPMHRFEAVANVRQSPAHDHAHGVIEVRRAHLVGDLDLLDAAFQCLHGSLHPPRRPACGRTARFL